MRTIKQLIADNKFDYCDSDITDANFPVIDDTDIAKVTIEDCGKDFTRDEAIEHLHKKGLRPVSAATALRYALANPDAQRKYWLLALSQTCRSSGGRVCVLVLHESDRLRSAHLDDVQDRFRRDCRVLAEPKELPVEPRTLEPGTRSLGHLAIQTSGFECPHCGEAIIVQVKK